MMASTPGQSQAESSSERENRIIFLLAWMTPRVFDRFFGRQRPYWRRAFDELHHKVVIAEIVKLADIRMIQGRDGSRFALKTFREFSLKTLTATIRLRRVSRALYTSPMPPAPMGAMISYGPSFAPGDNGI